MWQLGAKTLGMEVLHAALQLIAEIDEFKGKWEALRALSPERLLALRYIATVESIASSIRIEGMKLSDQEVEALLSNLQATPSALVTSRRSSVMPRRWTWSFNPGSS